MNLVCFLIWAMTLLVFVRIILSWFPVTGEGLLASAQRLTFSATEWLMGPLRKVIPPVRLGAAALDLSPLVVLLGLSVVRGLLCR